MTKQEFLRLVDTYLDGKASFQEEQQLLDFYNQFDISDNWDEEVLGGKALLEEKMLNRLMLSLNEQQPVHKLVFPLWTKIAAVASFILICTTAVFLYQHSQTDDLVLHTKADSRDFILPGKNQASLPQLPHGLSPYSCTRLLMGQAIRQALYPSYSRCLCVPIQRGV